MTGSYLIELIPKPNAPVVWGKVELALSADALPVEMRDFDEKGKLVRTLTYGGVEPARVAQVCLVLAHLGEGRYLAPGPAHEVSVGRALAKTLHAHLGDELVAVTQAADGSLGNDLYKLVGIYATGSTELDRGTAFVHLRDLQDLLV